MNRQTFDHALRHRFLPFARRSFLELQGSPMEESWHIPAVAYVCEELMAGRRRQIINMPPRTLKSHIVAAAWPAFLLGVDPRTEIIVSSYAETLAGDLSDKTRRLMRSPFYQRVFPGTRLVKQTGMHLETDLGGKRFATSIGGATTGMGADYIIIDDPHNASEAYSEAARHRVIAYYQQSLISRLNDPTKGRIILVMQRLHEADLSGHLQLGGGFDILTLQALATGDANIPMGVGQLHGVRAGDLLMPARLPQAWLDQQQLQMGSAMFSAQYQQLPVPADGAMVKRAWLRYGDVPMAAGETVLSLDAATKVDPQHDYSVCTVWRQHDGRHYLVDVWRDKVDFPSLLRAVEGLASRYSPRAILIEDAGSGSALIQYLQRSGTPAIGRKVKDAKEVRLAAVSAYLESGSVWLPTDAPWLAALESELLGFPGGRHDDQVDSITQYLGWVRDSGDGGRFDVFWT